MKSKLQETYPTSEYRTLNSPMIYVADFSLRTEGDRGVEIYTEIPLTPDGTQVMDCLTLTNDEHLNIDFSIFDDHQFKKEGKRAELGFLADQSPMPDALNYWTSFLNQNTAMIDSIERIARKLDYAVCYFDVTRESRGVYKIKVKLITDDIQSTPQYYVTEQYTRLLEETIKKQPECYLWSHNRWKNKVEMPNE